MAAPGDTSPASTGLITTGPLFSSSAFAPLVITPVFGTSILSLGGGSKADPTTTALVESSINAAIAYYDTNWTSSVPIGTVINGTIVTTVNVQIEFDYAPQIGAAFSSYTLLTTGDAHFASLVSALSGVLPNLPGTDPTGGAVFLETTAQSELLGLSIGSGTAGTVTSGAGSALSYDVNNQSVTGKIGAVGAIEHEIAEVFGRLGDLGAISSTYSILDLYRFTAPNVPALTAGKSDYFSLDNGTTALGYFNDFSANGGDAGDWASSGVHNVAADSFDAFITTGTAGTISSLDNSVLSAIGFHSVLGVPTQRTLLWTGAKDALFTTAADWNDSSNGLNPAQTAPGATDTARLLTAGGTITGNSTVAALEFGGIPLWNVSSSATLAALSGVTVGQGGSGAVVINGGASISGLGTLDTVTGASGGSASVAVDGTGSIWKSAGELVVGSLGAASMAITNKASVSAAATASLPAMVIGTASGGDGTFSISDKGSQATLSGQLTLGQAGSGHLRISNQGTLQTGGAAVAPSQGFDIAQSASGLGDAIVTGSKSLLTNTGQFVVGDAGLGSLSISAGGTVITTSGTVGGLAGLVIGKNAGASGSSVTVAGAGSNLKVTGLLDVGVAGSGSLQLSSGASVTAGSLDAGLTASAVGQISVSGIGTSLSVTGDATVADDGTGVLSVLDGATFSAANLTIGSQGNSSGALVVSGTGSVINLTGSLNIGTALGVGDLTIGPGGAVHAAVVNLQGQVVLEGGNLDPTVTIINQGQTAGGNGTIQAGFIVDEGVVQAGGTKPSQRLLIVDGTVVGGGTLTVNGTVQPSGPVGVLQINASGTLELTGPVLNAATTTFTDNLAQPGTYTVNNSVVDVTFADAKGVLLLDKIAGFDGTIISFLGGDSFVVTGGTLSNLNVSNSNTLTFSDSGVNAVSGGIDHIIFGSAVNAANFNIVNGNTVQVACFAVGTRIGTETGLVAVEDLTAGDVVITEDGRAEPIVWIGSRTVNCARHPKPETVWPVRVAAGAFGPGQPMRDLYLSPDHAVFVNGVLVPVKLLINGTSITQMKRDWITYFHIELPRHDVILAEGLTVESYLDSGDRQDFGGNVTRLFPDFATRCWELEGCARLVLTGPELEHARQSVVAVTGLPAASGLNLHASIS